MTAQLTFAIDATQKPVGARIGGMAPGVGAKPGDAPQRDCGPLVGYLCDGCGRGPVRAGDRCGWCGKRAPKAGETA